MKGISLFIHLALLCSMNLSAQTVIKGDMNDDGKVTIEDVTEVVNTVLKRSPLQNIGYVCKPFTVDNSFITGTWYENQSTKVTFNEDGTTDLIDNGRYEFLPIPGTLIIYNSSNVPKSIYLVYKVTDEDFLFANTKRNYPHHFTRQPHTQLVTEIELSSSSITLDANHTHKLNTNIYPTYADNKGVEWSTSDPNIATVSSSGVITAIGPGTCTITCAATDGSNKGQKCLVTVCKVFDDILTCTNEYIDTKYLGKKGQKLHLKWSASMHKYNVGTSTRIPTLEISICRNMGTWTKVLEKNTSSTTLQTYTGTINYTFDEDGIYYVRISNSNVKQAVISEIKIQ